MTAVRFSLALCKNTPVVSHTSPAINAICLRSFADNSTPEAPEEPEEPDVSEAQTDRAESGLDASTSEPGPRVRKKRLTRAQRGSWLGNPKLIEEMTEFAPVWPVNRPLYDVQGQAPWLLDATNPVFETYKQLRKDNPELFESAYRSTREDAPPRPGASKILDWEISVVFDSDPLSGEAHPLNKKAKCKVYLRDLQQEFGLSDAALQYIALICGPRYNPNKGLLTLTSEKTAEREDNRHHIVEMLHKLVEEGQRRYPASQAAAVEAG